MTNGIVYAIGDIHGHIDQLQEAHRRIVADQAHVGEPGTVVHVGDLVDRGPNSAGVIDWLLNGINAGKPWIVLKGNHDRMMSMYLQDTPVRDQQLRAEYEWVSPPLGGLTTLASYGVDTASDDLHRAARAAVPLEHRAFLAGLDTYYETPHALFVHAGIRPGVALDQQSEDDLVWIRKDFHDDPRDHGPLVVHGHTPVPQVSHYGNRVNIDTGVAFGGPLSVIVVDGRQVWELGPNGRLPVVTS